MTEKADARDYLLECADPEVLHRPQHLLYLRGRWREGTYRAGGSVQEMDPEEIEVLTEDDSVFPLSTGPDLREGTPHTERAASEGFKKFIVLYFAIVLLRALYKGMSGDDS